MDKNLVYLTQTDTTVGFLSANKIKLNLIKKRDLKKEVLQVVKDFSILQLYTRVPDKFKKRIRNSKQETFIYPNRSAFRVVKISSQHYNFIKKFYVLYSTSANVTNEQFDLEYASKFADIILYNKNNFNETNGSSIYKINNFKIKKVR